MKRGTQRWIGNSATAIAVTLLAIAWEPSRAAQNEAIALGVDNFGASGECGSSSTSAQGPALLHLPRARSVIRSPVFWLTQRWAPRHRGHGHPEGTVMIEIRETP